MFAELMFELEAPAVDRKRLKDVMTMYDAGFSFMDVTENRIQHDNSAMLNLLRAAPEDKSLVDSQQGWDRKRVWKYLEQKKRFLELMMLLFHLTGGQPARGTEIGSLKFRNTQRARRNFYIVNGHAMFNTTKLGQR
jgi:hypothetical protein